MRGDRSCLICGKKYNFCGDCSNNTRHSETWRYMYCSENCRDIFQVLSGKAFGHLSSEDAADQLSKLDTSKKAQYREDFRKQINEILASKKNSVKTKNETAKKKIVNDIDDGDEKLVY